MLFRIKNNLHLLFHKEDGKTSDRLISPLLSSLYKMSEILSKAKRCGAGTRAILPPRELNGRGTKKCVAKSRAEERKRTSK